MPDLAKAKEHWLIYKLVYVYVALFSFSSLGSCVLVAFAGGAKWVQMDNQEKVMVAIAIFVNWTAVMLALINKTVGQLTHGEIVLGSNGATPKGATEIVTRVTESGKTAEVSATVIPTKTNP